MRSRTASIVLALAVALLCASPWSASSGFAADESLILLQDEEDARYLLRVTGSVGGEQFSGVTAILQLSFPDIFSSNPYVCIISAYPKSQITNGFFWNTEGSPMEVLGTSLVSRSSNRGVGRSDNHFYHLSSALLDVPGLTTHRRKEVLEEARKNAVPTKVPAQAGELSLEFGGGSVHGSVWMNGYDPVGGEYVRYQANFVGSRTLEYLPQ